MTVDPMFYPVTAEPIASVVPLAAKRSNELDKDTFLKLMIAQLKNQDPSSPVDSKDFLVQTAQFSVVEKLEQMAKLNTELLAATRLGSASSLVGSSVSYLQPSADAEAAPVEMSGTVSGVRVTGDGLVLKVGTAEIALSAVTAVGPAPVDASPAAVTPAEAADAGVAAVAAAAAASTPTATTPTATTSTVAATPAVATPTDTAPGSSATAPNPGSPSTVPTASQ